MRLRDMMTLILLASLWGASFLFMRISAPVLGPLPLIELRVLIAAITLVGFALTIRHRVRILHRWWQYLILGAGNAALPFTFIAVAELRLDAGLASVLNATTPMFTALVSWLWAKERLSLGKMVGVLLGIVGVGILVGWPSSGLASHHVMFVGCSLLAAVSYGVSGVFSSKYLSGEQPLDLAIGQQLAASIVLLPFSVAWLPRRLPSSSVVVSVLCLSILCTAVAYLFFFALLQRVGPLKTLSVTFLVPVFGVFWGSLLLHEAVSAQLILGLAIVLVSVVLVVKPRVTQTARRPT